MVAPGVDRSATPLCWISAHRSKSSHRRQAADSMMDVSEDLYTWHDHRTVDYAYWEERLFGLINSLTGPLTVLMAPRPSRELPPSDGS